MSDDEMFHFDEGRPSFEDLGVPNGTHTWLDSDLMRVLGYTTGPGFQNAVNRAMQACISLNIKPGDNFIPHDGGYKLTRFACYLVAMNGDTKKPGVAAAQAYFAVLADTFQTHIDHADGLDRVLVRDEMSTGIKALASTASQHGVQNYAFFQNEGYRGMYNMGLADLSRRKGVGKSEKILDRMGKTELAANLFRVTQTEEKIRNENIRGQKPLEHAAHSVGRTVRETMIKISGKTPENLPLAAPIKDVKKTLKATGKKLKALDSGKAAPTPRQLPAAPPVDDEGDS